MMKLTSFFMNKPMKTIPTMLYLQTNCIWYYTALG